MEQNVAVSRSEFPYDPQQEATVATVCATMHCTPVCTGKTMTAQWQVNTRQLGGTACAQKLQKALLLPHIQIQPVPRCKRAASRLQHYKFVLSTCCTYELPTLIKINSIIKDMFETDTGNVSCSVRTELAKTV